MNIITEPIAKKRKRFNKNKKKAWRKKINISDIEEYLDHERREERTGGPLGLRISEELFSLDYGAEEKKGLRRRAKHAHFIAKDGLKPLYVKSKEKPLKCHQFIINGLPGAKAISVKKGVMKQKEKRVIKTVRRLSGQTTRKAHKQLMTNQKQRRSDLAKKKKVQEVNFETDLWNSRKDNLSTFNEVVKTFVEEPIDFYEVQTKQNKVKIPSVRFEKPSLLPSVIVPKSGASYNPSYDAHQELLAEALNAENQKHKKEKKERRMIEKYLPSAKDGITEAEKILEMSEGLPLNKNQQHLEIYNEEANGLEEEQSYVGHKKIEKKSKQTRRKAKTLQVKEQKRLKKKELKQRESNIYRLKSYEKNIRLMEKKTEILKERKRRKRVEDQFKTKQLSRHTFEEDDVLVPLGNEICNSLRTLEPAGNPMESVYKNFQRRNMVEKLVRVMKPKRKQKMIYKSSTKGKLNLGIDDDDDSSSQPKTVLGHQQSKRRNEK